MYGVGDLGRNNENLDYMMQGADLECFTQEKDHRATDATVAREMNTTNMVARTALWDSSENPQLVKQTGFWVVFIGGLIINKKRRC